MATAHARNADLTGRNRLAGQKAHAEELEAREQEVSLAAAREVESRDSEMADYSKGSAPVIVDVVKEPLEVSAEWRVIRVNEDLDDVTIGVGNNYSFRAGQKTKVPAHVADHLEELGYVWH